MPATVADARDLLISSVLLNDPVVFIDDRWLYDQIDRVPEVKELPLAIQGPKVLNSGDDITIVGLGYGTKCAMDSLSELSKANISAEVIDLRVLNPLDPSVIIESVRKTGRLIVVDPGWRSWCRLRNYCAGIREYRYKVNAEKPAENYTP